MNAAAATVNGGYRTVRVRDCNCGWGYPHEPGCGTDIDDRYEPRRPTPAAEDGGRDAAA